MTHDASFQGLDEHKAQKQLGSGTEINFVDSYKYNIAAYWLAELLGLDYSEAKLLAYAYAFEQATQLRKLPMSTPSLANEP